MTGPAAPAPPPRRRVPPPPPPPGTVVRSGPLEVPRRWQPPLGSAGRPPAVSLPRARDGLDTGLAADAVVHLMSAPVPTVGLDEVVDRVLDLVLGGEPVTPCLVGPPGSGRTTALAAVGAALAARSGLTGLTRVRAEVVLGNRRGETLREVRDELGSGTVVGLDDLEVLLGLASGGVDADLRWVVRSLLGRPEHRVVVAVDADFLDRLQRDEPELRGELVLVPLPELGPDELAQVASGRARHHLSRDGVTVTDEALARAVAPAGPSDTRAHPGLMVERLDVAVTGAVRRGASTVVAADLVVDDRREGWADVDLDRVRGRLAERVVGQDGVIGAVLDRLRVTALDLDGNPDRPNGVFLLVGPSGVGKTALAKGLAEEAFVDDDHLVRLDMSEYSDENSVSRLFGPPPGYVGSDLPAGWLTTKVRRKPVSVVLLDEVEKAHPDVWNVFLQVLDDGRLTDSAGTTTSFADTVVVMTSNLGTTAFSRAPVGFGGDDGTAAGAADDVRAAIRRVLPPELVGRIDEVFVLEPLTRDALVDIARREVAAAVARLGERGWRLDVGDDVVAHLAELGFDPALGARHLQRNVERALLGEAVGRDKGTWRVRMVDGAVAFEAEP